MKALIYDFLLLPFEPWEKTALADVIVVASMFVAIMILVTDALGV